MAEITFTLAEVIDVLAANEFLPKEISDLQINGSSITFKYKLKMPFATTVDVSLEFLEFEKGLLMFRIKTAWLVEKALKNPAVFSNKYLEFDKSNLIIYLDMFVKDHLKGLQIDSISFRNYRFEVKVFST